MQVSSLQPRAPKQRLNTAPPTVNTAPPTVN